ncbi:MAG: hypothetical protein M0C28_46005 [Candidatus Moduliflexus flocculans]|nr:hypothetical protein [Candidatus Moduliflexus flocculans]
MERGFIDGDNSGSASLDYGEKWFLFKAVEFYFPGLGFSVSYLSPKGIKGMAGRIAYSDLVGPVHHGPGRGPVGRAARAARRARLPRLRLHLAAHLPDLRPRPREPGQDGHAGQPLPHGHGPAAAPLAALLRLRQHPQLPLGERAGVRRGPRPAPADALPHERRRDDRENALGRPEIGPGSHFPGRELLVGRQPARLRRGVGEREDVLAADDSGGRTSC